MQDCVRGQLAGRAKPSRFARFIAILGSQDTREATSVEPRFVCRLAATLAGARPKIPTYSP